MGYENIETCNNDKSGITMFSELETADSKSYKQIKDALRGGAYLYIEKPIRFENLKNVFETLGQERRVLEEKPSDDLEKISHT